MGVDLAVFKCFKWDYILQLSQEKYPKSFMYRQAVGVHLAAFSGEVRDQMCRQVGGEVLVILLSPSQEKSPNISSIQMGIDLSAAFTIEIP